MNTTNTIIAFVVLAVVVIALVMFDVKIATANYSTPTRINIASLSDHYCSDRSIQASIKLEEKTRKRSQQFRDLGMHTITDQLLAESVNLLALNALESLVTQCEILKIVKQGGYQPALGDSGTPYTGGMIQASTPPDTVTRHGSDRSGG